MSGRLIIMGSGELAPGLVATHRAALTAVGADEVVVLDTPYGFQENADQLTERIVGFFRRSMGIPARVAGLRSRHPDPATRERFLATLGAARYVFAGPGSPTYALDIWRDVGAGPVLAEVVRSGGAVVFSSAAALTLGRHTLPVYEIYKVGADLSWADGLDVMTSLAVPATVIPHWDNREGGNHDTSRCYVGRRRFTALAARLDAGVIGVDEHTAAIFDFASGRLDVAGRGGVTLDTSTFVPAGASLGIDEVRRLLGAERPAAPQPAATVPWSADFDEAVAAGDSEGILTALLGAEAAGEEGRARLRRMLVTLVDVARAGLVEPRETVKGFVDLLLTVRDRARAAGAYDLADLIRAGLDDLGIEVRDTRDGTRWDLRR